MYSQANVKAASGGVVEMVGEWVALAPASPAVRMGGRVMSYATLAEQSRRWCAQLRAAGVRPGVPVAMLLEPSIELPGILLGVLQAGGVLLPLDPESPPRRLAAQVRQCRVTVGVSDTTRAGMLASLGISAVTGTGKVKTSIQPPEPAREWESLAYVIYTSGSSGEPKGVMVGHEALAAHIRWLRRNLPLAPGHQVLQLAPLSFDASMTEFFWPLCSGATVVLETSAYRDISAIDRVLSTEDIYAVRLTPAYLTELVHQQCSFAWPHLRYLISGGAVLPDSIRDQVLTSLSDARLINRYGPTEAVVAVTYGTCEAGTEGTALGQPVDGVRLYVLDGQGCEVGSGEEGELFIGGTQLADGYVNDPQLTARRFIADPFGPLGSRMYATGDLVRKNKNGDLVFIGRLDSQLSLRGIRIEPAEIERVLRRHPGVDDCAVTVTERLPGDQHLLAVVVPSKGAEGLKLGDLRRFASSWLPARLLPSRLRTVDRLPLTRNGKLDRNRLGCLDHPLDPNPKPTLASHQSAVSSQLAACWAEVTGRHPAHDLDDFFETGGNSLNATRLQARLRQRLGVQLPIRAIFESPQFAQLTAVIETYGATVGESAASTLPGETSRNGGPLTFSQERLWLIQQLVPDTVAYNFQTILRWTGELDVNALRISLGAILARHEVLHSRVVVEEGQPRFETIEPQPPEIASLDLSGEPITRREQLARAAAGRFVRQAFDLANPPLIRWMLITLDPAQHWLVHSQSHLVHDGWSFNVFLSELCDGYRKAHKGLPVSHVGPRVQVPDIAQAERGELARGDLAAGIDHFTRKLRRTTPVEWRPAYRGDDEQPGTSSDAAIFEGGLIKSVIPPSAVNAMRNLARRLELSEFMVGFAAFAALLGTALEPMDGISFAIGTSIANRRRAESEGLIGCLLNNFAIPVCLQPDISFADFSREIGNELLDAYEHQEAPFQEVVRKLNVRRHADRNPVFQISYNFHDSSFPDTRLPDVTLGIEEGIDNGTGRFDLDVVVIPAAHLRDGANGTGQERCEVIWRYLKRRINPDAVRTLIGRYTEILTTAARLPEATLQDLWSQSTASASDDQAHCSPIKPDDAQAAARSGSAVTPGRSAQERSPESLTQLSCAIIAEVLHLPSVKPEDNFFDVGGHSLAATRVIARLREEVSEFLPLSFVFDADTIAKLGDMIADHCRR